MILLQVYQTNFKNYSTSTDSYIIFYELEPLANLSITNLESKTSTVTSNSAFQLLSASSKSPVNGYFSSMYFQCKIIFRYLLFCLCFITNLFCV